MILNVSPAKAGLLYLTLTASLIIFCGCSKTDSTTTSTDSTPKPGSSGTVAAAGGAGEAAFQSKCMGCHSVNGNGGRKGPDLTHAGAEASHTPEWLAEFIKDPKSKDPGSRMPGFAGRLSDTEVQTISAYVAGLK